MASAGRYSLLAEVVKNGCLRQRAKYWISYIPVWRQPPYFFSLAVRGHPRDPLQRKIASFTLTNHDDNERKRIALKYTMLCGCIYGLKCGTVFVGMTVPWKLLPDRRTTKVRASVGPTTMLPVRVRGPALILKTVDITRRSRTFVLFHLYGNKGVSLPLWPPDRNDFTPLAHVLSHSGMVMLACGRGLWAKYQLR